MKINSAGGTHIGKVRGNNEDNFYINGIYKYDMAADMAAAEDDAEREQYVYAICDGMGGEAMGELAAFQVLETLDRYADLPELEELLPRYVAEVNGVICEEIERNDGRRIGATLALLLICREEVTVCNIGDSRIYRYRAGELMQLSKDHTRAQQMIDAGILSAEFARNRKEKHVLTQHIGIFPQEFILEPHVEQRIPLSTGDIFLLCSDGLTDMVEDSQIREIIAEFEHDIPKIIVCELMRAVLDAGGKDNASIIIIKTEKANG